MNEPLVLIIIQSPIGHFRRICVRLTGERDVLAFKDGSVVAFDSHVRRVLHLLKFDRNFNVEIGNGPCHFALWL